MPDGQTSVYEFVLPEIGGSDDTWGDKLNANLEKIDDLFNQAFENTDEDTLGKLRSEKMPDATSNFYLTFDGTKSIVFRNADEEQEAILTYNSGSNYFSVGLYDFANTQYDARLQFNADGSIEAAVGYLSGDFKDGVINNTTIGATTPSTGKFTAITGNAVQQSTTDNTSGRLLTVGAFGLDVAVSLTSGDNLDNLTISGLYFNPSGANTTGNNYPEATAGALINVYRSSINHTQIYITTGVAAATGPRMWIRSKYAGPTWSSWLRIGPWGAGSASAPSIFMNGDTDTGLYSPSDNNIGFASNGAQVGQFGSDNFHILGGKLRLNSADILGGRVNISDDAVATVTVPFVQGQIFFHVRQTDGAGGAPLRQFSGRLSYANSVSSNIIEETISGWGANLDVVSGAYGVLTGTTGADGSFTIGFSDATTMYIENRSGSARTVRYTVL